MDEPGTFTIAATGDLHFRTSDKGKWLKDFGLLNKKADVLLIAGDLTDTGGEEEAHLLAEELQELTIPVLMVLGNHDCEQNRQAGIAAIISRYSKGIVLNGDSYIIGDIGFAGVKGFCGGFDNFMLSMFGEEVNKAFVQESVNEALNLDKALARLEKDERVKRKVVLMHYAPIQKTVEGEPLPIYPYLGTSRLAEPLVQRKVQYAFHGHAHNGTIEGSIGSKVKVFNVAQHLLRREFDGHPFFYVDI